MSTLRTNEILDLDDNPLNLSSNIVTISTGTQTVAEALNSKATNVVSEVNVYIPSDYPSLQEAIDDLSSQKPSSLGKINLVIESGHLLTRGIYLENGDFSMFYILSEDSVVELSPDFPEEDSICWVEYAKAPTLGCLINMDGKGHFGYVLRSSSWGQVLAECGVHGGDVNLQVWEASTVDARSTSWKFAQKKDWGRNVWISSASRADMQMSSNLLPPTDCSGAEVRNIYVSRGSTLNFADGISRDSATDSGLYVIRSWAVCNNADLQNNAIYGIAAFASSIVDARAANTSGSGSYGVFSESGSSVAFGGGTSNNCTPASVRASAAARIDAGGITASGSDYAIEAFSGGLINATGGSLSGTVDALDVREGGIVYRNSALYFGSVMSEKGSPIRETYTDGDWEITKMSDGTMELRLRYLELSYVNDRSLSSGSIPWPVEFIDTPHISMQAWHSSYPGLPSTPSHFSENINSAPISLVVRNVSSIDTSIYATSPNGSFSAGNNAYVSISATGRWK